MATVIKGLILRQDLNNYDGVNRTDTRVDSTGGTITGLFFISKKPFGFKGFVYFRLCKYDALFLEYLLHETCGKLD